MTFKTNISLPVKNDNNNDNNVSRGTFLVNVLADMTGAHFEI